MIRSVTARDHLRTEVAERGFAIVADCISDNTAKNLIGALDGEAAGKRNLLNIAEIRELARSESIRGLMISILGPDARAVKGTFFNKTPQSNWKVAWHQDLTITVRNRIDIPGFGPWTIKDGVQNVQPPTEILAGVLAIRIHLDENNSENGPVRVLPGSHRHGRLSSDQIIGWDKSNAITCMVPHCGALLMRPLLLHASSACLAPGNRRVIHLEFSDVNLPAGLHWHMTA